MAARRRKLPQPKPSGAEVERKQLLSCLDTRSYGARVCKELDSHFAFFLSSWNIHFGVQLYTGEKGLLDTACVKSQLQALYQLTPVCSVAQRKQVLVEYYCEFKRAFIDSI